MRTSVLRAHSVLQGVRVSEWWGAHGARSLCKVLPRVNGIAERGNVITPRQEEAANYSQHGMEGQDQTH